MNSSSTDLTGSSIESSFFSIISCSFIVPGEEMSWGGDWMCGGCQHINFKKREMCQCCGLPKYGGKNDASAYENNTNTNRTEVLAGDWYCQDINCGTHNYASRTSCFRCGIQKSMCSLGCCGASSVTSSGAGYTYEANPPGWKTGDWICTRPGCGVHNYACRMECFRCKTPRDYGGMY
ncbi:uncharacterized protein [Spinacia oleracea]|uniref:Uncharacterized protein isoform X1 n=2 Tax=Spinacia oleracea TaxID=3562 RepID=A0A9R0K4P0_SPIOL|nr:uncharacterized protein LOC110797616 isoform X1 [Spinacia oleracea]